MKSLNWGWKIALLYSGFVVMIIVLVGMSVSQKIDLVSEDYYAQELIHQQKLDKIRRAKALEEPLKINVGTESIDLVFPSSVDKGSIGGVITFYCPADERKDVTIPVLPVEGSVQRIAKSNLAPGRYRLQVDWNAGAETYWDETIVNVSE